MSRTLKDNPLGSLIASARRVRATCVFYKGPTVPREREVTEFDQADALVALRRALEVAELTNMSCGCIPGVTFEFFDGRNRPITSLRWHHGCVSWNGWASDAMLVDGTAPLRWLSDQGAPAALRNFEEEEQERQHLRQESERHERDWLAAVPSCAQNLTAAMLRTSKRGTVPEQLVAQVRQCVETAYPDDVERAKVLLAWFGRGTGRCSGYAIYEQIPGTLLRDLPIDAIIAALESTDATDAHDAGAVRHLVGSNARDKQSEDIGRLPEDVYARLRNAALVSDDADKRRRAEHWFKAR